jgi:aminopeptidase 2
VPARELLPANVVPKHYNLTLEPDFDKFTFEGTVVVDVDVVEDSSSISLNSLELEIHSGKISVNGESIRFVIFLIPRSPPSLALLTLP